MNLTQRLLALVAVVTLASVTACPPWSIDHLAMARQRRGEVVNVGPAGVVAAPGTPIHEPFGHGWLWVGPSHAPGLRNNPAVRVDWGSMSVEYGVVVAVAIVAMWLSRTRR